MILGITGHRPDKLGGYQPNELRYYALGQMCQWFEALKPKLVITGMALGVDQWAAHLAWSYEIPFVAAVPFQGQESAWPEASQREYKMLLELAARVVVVSPGGYSARKMHIRNQYIVDHCQTLLAVWDNSEGGTSNCVRYALKKDGPELIIIDPRDYAQSRSTR